LGNDSDALAGIILGILGLAAIVKILEKKCPTCRRSIVRGQNICQHCGSAV